MPLLTLPSNYFPRDGINEGLFGLPGGLPTDRTPDYHLNLVTTYGADPTGGVDIYDAAMAAYADIIDGRQQPYLPPGTYRLDRQIHVPGNGAGVAWGGAGCGRVAGEPLTEIICSASSAFQLGDDPSIGNVFNGGGEYRPWATIVSADEGDTVLTYSNLLSLQDFVVGKMCRIWTPNVGYDVSEGNNKGTFVFTCIVTGKSGANLTIFPPTPFDLRNALIVQSSNTIPLHRPAVQNMRITNRGGCPYPINFTGCHQPYIYNVDFNDESGSAMAYPIAMLECVQPEIRRVYISGNLLVGNSHAGIHLDFCSNMRVADSIILDKFPATEYNFGCVYGLTEGVAADRNGGLAFDWNHGPFNRFLYHEACKGPSAKADGYYGGDRNNGLYRCFIHGQDSGAGGGQFTPVDIGRFCRQPFMVGNIFQSYGLTWDFRPVAFGNPYLGNGISVGQSAMSCCRATLTTRISATAGVLTLPAGHTLSSGQVIDMGWDDLQDGYHQCYVRRDVVLGTISGLTVPFSGGSGEPLIAQGGEILVPTTNDAIRAMDVDVDPATLAPYLWSGTVTARSNPDGDGYYKNGTVQLDSLAQAATLQVHLDHATPGGGPLMGYIGGRASTITGIDLSTGVVTFIDSYTDGVPQHGFPAVGQPWYGWPSFAGFGSRDIDTQLTAYEKANCDFHTSPSGGIPVVQQLAAGVTLPPSLIYTSRPAYFRSMVWPPFDSSTPPLSVTERNLPSESRFYDGLEEPGGGGGGSVPTLRSARAPGYAIPGS